MGNMVFRVLIPCSLREATQVSEERFPPQSPLHMYYWYSELKEVEMGWTCNLSGDDTRNILEGTVSRTVTWKTKKEMGC